MQEYRKSVSQERLDSSVCLATKDCLVCQDRKARLVAKE